jgi:two-component system cell cycle sensor histidine kinase/response regulator CckA
MGENEHEHRQDEKLETIGRLASGVAHDFNNLLLVIAGNAQLALAADGLAARAELDEILRATAHAAELVRQLLAVARTETSVAAPLELNEVVGDVCRMLDRMLDESIEIRTDLTSSDTTILADAVQLERVLLNLAANARDAMPLGGRLTIATAQQGRSIVLRVTDTGTGMDAHTRDQAFVPFFTTKVAGEGTGVGLSTVYAIVSKAGGRITVDSDLGHGTTFTIVLPHAGVVLLQHAA